MNSIETPKITPETNQGTPTPIEGIGQEETEQEVLQQILQDKNNEIDRLQQILQHNSYLSSIYQLRRMLGML